MKLPYTPLRPPYIPEKKVIEMNLDEFIDFLEMRRKYNQPGMRKLMGDDRYESEGVPLNFNSRTMPENLQGIASNNLFWKWKTGSSDSSEDERLREYGLI